MKQFPFFHLAQKETPLSSSVIPSTPGALQVLFALGLFGIALSGTQTFMERLATKG